MEAGGRLAIGKFPSVGDTRSITRGEVLALKLAALAGIDVAAARILQVDDTPVAVIRRFDREDADGRIPYQSAASLLQASRTEDRSYTEIVDAIRTHGHSPTADVQQLWRWLVFNLLITNVGDHAAVSDWRRLACTSEVGLRPVELDDFAPRFEH